MSLKNIKAGDSVIVKGFTGIKLGVFKVDKATDKNITVVKKNGDKMIFSKKDGIQVNIEEGRERYANSIIEDDGSYVAPQHKKAKPEGDEAPKKDKKAKPAKTKKAAPEPEEELEEDDDEDDFEEDEDDFEDIDE
jgi:hypothetical protein